MCCVCVCVRVCVCVCMYVQHYPDLAKEQDIAWGRPEAVGKAGPARTEAAATLGVLDTNHAYAGGGSVMPWELNTHIVPESHSNESFESTDTQYPGSGQQ